MGSSFAFLLYAARAYVDVPFLALVLWAAALEARAPRRGLAVMATLAVAGLLRPEAWVLAGAYWLWCGWRRLDLLALAAAAPLVWCLVDLWVTGDPLFSLHATNDLADELNRNRGLSSVPGSFASFVTDTARPPVALAGRGGGAAAVAAAHRPRAARAHRALRRRRGHLPGHRAGRALGPAALPHDPGGGRLPGRRLRRARLHDAARGPRAARCGRAPRSAPPRSGSSSWPIKAPVVGTLRGELRFIKGSHDDLVAILHAPAVQRDLRCGPLTYPNYRLVPDSRWLLDLPARRVGARSARRRTRGVAMFVLGTKELKRYGFAAGASPSTNVPDPGFVPIARNARFSAYAACG